MASPLVSVLITVYNRELYIAEAIESVLNSSYKDFEVIIVDDCSTDNSCKIALKYQQTDARIKVYLNEKNLGDYKNRNMASFYAKGKYIKYLDADDTIYPHGLQVMVEAMESNPNAVLGIQSIKREDKKPYPILVSPVEVFQEHFLNGGLLLAGPTGVILKREIFEFEGGFSGTRFIGDTELWLKLAMKYPIVKFQSSLIWWRMHSDQEMAKEKMTFQSTLKRYELDKSFLLSKQCPLVENERELAYKKLNRRYLVNLVHYFRSKKNVDVIVYFFKAKISLIDLFKSIFH
jgi:glycosyltransferase involved in cell wall biosynthesis